MSQEITVPPIMGGLPAFNSPWTFLPETVVYRGQERISETEWRLKFDVLPIDTEAYDRSLRNAIFAAMYFGELMEGKRFAYLFPLGKRGYVGG